jgi:hypothetical protein
VRSFAFISAIRLISKNNSLEERKQGRSSLPYRIARELCALQLRLTFECTAMACLCANRHLVKRRELHGRVLRDVIGSQPSAPLGTWPKLVEEVPLDDVAEIHDTIVKWIQIHRIKIDGGEHLFRDSQAAMVKASCWSPVWSWRSKPAAPQRRIDLGR